MEAFKGLYTFDYFTHSHTIASKHKSINFRGGIRGTVVAHFTTGQQVERSILHQGRSVTKYIPSALVIPGPV